MPYCRLYYHLVWATRGREPLISAKIEAEVYDAIKLKIKALGGQTFAVNGMEDHLHVAAAIPPTLAVAKFIGEVKGASSFHVNHLPGNQYHLDWQRGYGAISLRQGDLQQVVDYINSQKTHHSEGKVWPSLEECSEEDGVRPSMVREEPVDYDPFA
jgi:putative transposase